MLYRFNLDLAIPQSSYDSLSLTRKQAFRDEVRNLKALAVKINEGTVNEEATVRATWHKCHHDTGGPCEKENEI